VPPQHFRDSVIKISTYVIIILIHEWWGAGMAICMGCSVDLHMAQLMPLPLTVSCFSKIQIGFTFLVPADPGSPGQRAIKQVCVCNNNDNSNTNS